MSSEQVRSRLSSSSKVAQVPLDTNQSNKYQQAMHGLQLPRPSSPSSLPPLDPTPSSSTSSVPPPRQHRAPPPSFAAARVQARQIRGENKSPFVPRAKNHGKDRDLSTLSVDQLADMLARNARLLENPYVPLPTPSSSEHCVDEIWFWQRNLFLPPRRRLSPPSPAIPHRIPPARTPRRLVPPRKPRRDAPARSSKEGGRPGGQEGGRCRGRRGGGRDGGRGEDGRSG